RRYGTVMVARAYADWSRQPEPFKGSLTAAMIDRVDCPAKQRDRIRMGTVHYSGNTPSGSLGYTTESGTYPSRSWSSGSTGNTGHMPDINPGSSNTIVQSTVVQSTVDLNMLMDIIETVFDRPTISTFVLMTGDKDFTRISARLKLRLNKTVIVVGIPGTVSRDLISSANQFVPLVPGGAPVGIGVGDSGFGSMSMTGNTGSMAAISIG